MPSKNSEVLKKASKKHWEKIKDDPEVKRKARERAKKWAEENKEKIKAYREANKEKLKQMKKEWVEKNREHVNKYKVENQRKNISSAIARTKKYQKTEKGKVSARTNRDMYRKHLRERSLNGYMIERTREIYRMSKQLTASTGIVHHVDHIIPIRGENVSGLHTFWNLRVISGKENQRKTNSIDMELIMSLMQEDIDSANTSS